MNRTSPSSSSKSGTAPTGGVALRRDRIIDKLTESLVRRLTLVVAPAGFGKTAAVRGFAAELDGPPAWIDLREWHSEPRELFDSIARALDADRAEIPAGADISELRHQLRLLLWSAGRETSIEARPSPAAAVLVFDDFQAIEGSPTACALIEEVLESAPEGWHIVLSSRRLPRLRAVSHLMTGATAAYLGAEDLRFDAQKHHLLLPRSHGARSIAGPRRRDCRANRRLARRSRAGRRIGAEGVPEYGARATIFLDDVLEETFARRRGPALLLALDQRPARTRPGRLRPGWAVPTHRALLREAEQGQAFITGPEGGASASVLVPAFRRFLAQRLRSAKPAVFTSISQRAGGDFAARGDYEKADAHLHRSRPLAGGHRPA